MPQRFGATATAGGAMMQALPSNSSCAGDANYSYAGANDDGFGRSTRRTGGPASSRAGGPSLQRRDDGARGSVGGGKATRDPTVASITSRGGGAPSHSQFGGEGHDTRSSAAGGGSSSYVASSSSSAGHRKCMLFLFSTRTLMYRYPSEDTFTISKGFELGGDGMGLGGGGGADGSGGWVNGSSQAGRSNRRRADGGAAILGVRKRPGGGGPSTVDRRAYDERSSVKDGLARGGGAGRSRRARGGNGLMDMTPASDDDLDERWGSSSSDSSQAPSSAYGSSAGSDGEGAVASQPGASNDRNRRALKVRDRQSNRGGKGKGNNGSGSAAATRRPPAVGGYEGSSYKGSTRGSALPRGGRRRGGTRGLSAQIAGAMSVRSATVADDDDDAESFSRSSSRVGDGLGSSEASGGDDDYDGYGGTSSSSSQGEGSRSQSSRSSSSGASSSSSSLSSSTDSSSLSSSSYTSSVAAHDITLWSTQATKHFVDTVEAAQRQDDPTAAAAAAAAAAANKKGGPQSAGADVLSPNGTSTGSAALAGVSDAPNATVGVGDAVKQTVKYSAAEQREQKRRNAQQAKEDAKAKAVADRAAAQQRMGERDGDSPTPAEGDQGAPLAAGAAAVSNGSGRPPATGKDAGSSGTVYQSAHLAEGRRILGIPEATLGHLLTANIGGGVDGDSSVKVNGVAVLRIGSGALLLIFPVAMRAAATSAAVERATQHALAVAAGGSSRPPTSPAPANASPSGLAARGGITSGLGRSPPSATAADAQLPHAGLTAARNGSFGGAQPQQESTKDPCGWDDGDEDDQRAVPFSAAAAIANYDTVTGTVRNMSPSTGSGSTLGLMGSAISPLPMAAPEPPIVLSFATGTPTSASAATSVIAGGATAVPPTAGHKSGLPVAPVAPAANHTTVGALPSTAHCQGNDGNVYAPPAASSGNASAGGRLSSFDAAYVPPPMDHSTARLVVALEGLDSALGVSMGETIRFVQTFVSALEREEARSGYLTAELEGMAAAMASGGGAGNSSPSSASLSGDGYGRQGGLTLWWELQQLARCVAGEDVGSALTLGATIGHRNAGQHHSPGPVGGPSSLYATHPHSVLQRFQQHHFSHHLSINKSLHVPSLYLRHFDANDSRIAFLGSGKRQVLATARHSFPPEWVFILNTSTSHFVRGGGFCHSCFVKESMAPRYAQIMGHSGARALTIEAVRNLLVNRLGNPPHTVKGLTQLLLREIVEQHHQSAMLYQQQTAASTASGNSIVNISSSTNPTAAAQHVEDSATDMDEPPGGGMGSRANTQTPTAGGSIGRARKYSSPPLPPPPASGRNSAIPSGRSTLVGAARPSVPNGASSGPPHHANSSRANALAIKAHQEQALAMIDTADARFFVAQVLELLSLARIITLQRPTLATTMTDLCPMTQMTPSYLRNHCMQLTAWHFGALTLALGEEAREGSPPSLAGFPSPTPPLPPPAFHMRCVLGSEACTVCQFMKSWNVHRYRTAHSIARPGPDTAPALSKQVLSSHDTSTGGASGVGGTGMISPAAHRPHGGGAAGGGTLLNPPMSYRDGTGGGGIIDLSRLHGGGGGGGMNPSYHNQPRYSSHYDERSIVSASTAPSSVAMFPPTAAGTGRMSAVGLPDFPNRQLPCCDGEGDVAVEAGHAEGGGFDNGAASGSFTEQPWAADHRQPFAKEAALLAPHVPSRRLTFILPPLVQGEPPLVSATNTNTPRHGHDGLSLPRLGGDSICALSQRVIYPMFRRGEDDGATEGGAVSGTPQCQTVSSLLEEVMAMPIHPPLLLTPQSAGTTGAQGLRSVMNAGREHAPNPTSGSGAPPPPSSSSGTSSGGLVGYGVLFKGFEAYQQRCDGANQASRRTGRGGAAKASAKGGMPSSLPAGAKAPSSAAAGIGVRGVGVDGLPLPTAGIVGAQRSASPSSGAARPHGDAGRSATTTAATTTAPSDAWPLKGQQQQQTPASGAVDDGRVPRPDLAMGALFSFASSSRPGANGPIATSIDGSDGGRDERTVTERVLDVLYANDTAEGALYRRELSASGQGDAVGDHHGDAPPSLRGISPAEHFLRGAQQQQWGGGGRSSSPLELAAEGGDGGVGAVAVLVVPVLSPSDAALVSLMASLYAYRANNSSELLGRAWVGCLPFAEHLKALGELGAHASSPSGGSGAGAAAVAGGGGGVGFNNPAAEFMVTPSTVNTVGAAGFGAMYSTGSMGLGRGGSTAQEDGSSTTTTTGGGGIDSLSRGVTFMMADRGWLASHPSLQHGVTPPSPGRALPFLESPQTVTTIGTIGSMGFGGGVGAAGDGTVSPTASVMLGAGGVGVGGRPVSGGAPASAARSRTPPRLSANYRQLHDNPCFVRAPRGIVPYPIALTVAIHCMLLHWWCGHRLHTLKEVVAALKEPFRDVGRALRRAKVIVTALDAPLRAMLGHAGGGQGRGGGSSRRRGIADAGIGGGGPEPMVGPHVLFLRRYVALVREEEEGFAPAPSVQGDGVGSPPPSPSAPSPVFPPSFVSDVKASLFVSLVRRQPLTPLEEALAIRGSESATAAMGNNIAAHDDGGGDGSAAAAACSVRGQAFLSPASFTYHVLQHRAVYHYVSRVKPPSTEGQARLWVDYVAWVQGHQQEGEGAPLDDEGSPHDQRAADGSIAVALAQSCPPSLARALSSLVFPHVHPRNGGTPPPTAHSASSNNNGASAASSPLRPAVAPSLSSSLSLHSALSSLQYAHAVLGVDPMILYRCAGYRLFPTGGSAAMALAQHRAMVLRALDPPTCAPNPPPSAAQQHGGAQLGLPSPLPSAATSPQLVPHGEGGGAGPHTNSNGATTNHGNGGSGSAFPPPFAMEPLGPEEMGAAGRPPSQQQPRGNSAVPSSPHPTAAPPPLPSSVASEEKDHQGYLLLLAHHAINLYSDIVLAHYVPVSVENGGGDGDNSEDDDDDVNAAS